jgi:hypothetical protein
MRLLVAAAACVVVWQLALCKEEKAATLRNLLVRLSGRLMKRGVEYTASALLAGMWNLLAMLDLLDQYSPTEIRRIASFLPDLIE